METDNSEVVRLLRELIAKVDRLTLLVQQHHPPAPLANQVSDVPPQPNQVGPLFLFVPSTLPKKKVNDALRRLCPTGFDHARPLQPFADGKWIVMFTDKYVRENFLKEHPTLTIDGQECSVSKSRKADPIPKLDDIPPPIPPPTITATLLYSYTASDNPTTSMEAGETVVVVQPDKDGWTYVQKNNQTPLYVPTTYLQL